jgi:hypothetical protein
MSGKIETAKSHLDALAEMRDYKRRRQSYRAKNVHMTKRTNVEVRTVNIWPFYSSLQPSWKVAKRGRWRSTGMFAFNSQMLVPRVCNYIKSGHTFGCQAVNCSRFVHCIRELSIMWHNETWRHFSLFYDWWLSIAMYILCSDSVDSHVSSEMAV